MHVVYLQAFARSTAVTVCRAATGFAYCYIQTPILHQKQFIIASIKS